MVDAVGIGERLARLCRRYEIDDVDGYAALAGAAEVLDRIRSAIAAGRIGDALAEDLNMLEDAVAAVDLDGLTAADRGYRQPLVALGHQVVYAEVCPNGSCNRVEPSGAAGGAARTCGVGGAPLRRVRVRT